MKGYITKYALSTGITEQEFRTISKEGNIFVLSKETGEYASYTIGKDAFVTKEDSVKDAEKRRVKRIESLRKQIRKLEAMVF